MLEKEIQASCIQWLQYQGVFCWKQYNGGLYDKTRETYYFAGKRGVPDIIGLLPPHAKLDGEPVGGHFLGVEVKRPGGKRSPEQVEFGQNIARNGGISLCVYSLDELIEDMTPILSPAQQRLGLAG